MSPSNPADLFSKITDRAELSRVYALERQKFRGGKISAEDFLAIREAYKAREAALPLVCYEFREGEVVPKF